MGEIKKGWAIIVVTVLLNLAASFILFGASNNRDTLNKKAEITYVDKEIKHVNDRIDAHEKSQENSELKTQQQLDAIDGKLDLILDKMIK